MLVSPQACKQDKKRAPVMFSQTSMITPEVMQTRLAKSRVCNLLLRKGGSSEQEYGAHFPAAEFRFRVDSPPHSPTIWRKE